MSTPYHIRISPTAKKQILSLPSKQQKMLIKIAEALQVNPRLPGAKKIEGMTGLYSEAVNQQLRLIYKVEDQEVLLLIIK